MEQVLIDKPGSWGKDMTYTFIGVDRDAHGLKLLFQDAAGTRMRVSVENFVLARMPRDLAMSYTACAHAAAAVITHELPIRTIPHHLGDIELM